MGYWGTSGFGEYVGSGVLGHAGISGHDYKPDASRKAVVFHSGNTLSPFDYQTTVSAGAACTAPLADAEYPVISFSVPVTERYGCDTNTTRIGQLWSFMQTRFGVATDKFYGIGSSKGATGLLNYTKANPTKVAGLALLIPAVDIQELYDSNRAGIAADIANSYGGRPDDAHNPIKNAVSFAGIPIRFWYSDTDPVVLSASTLAFAAALGVQAINTGSHGHDATYVDPNQVFGWFDSLENPLPRQSLHAAGHGQ